MEVTAHILEIGDFHYVKREYPERTTLLWTGRKPPGGLDRSQYFDCTPGRIRRDKRWQRRLAKIRPIALPSPAIDTGALWPGEFPEKTIDVFFSGNVTENAWVRRTGVADLEQLAARGIKVDFPAERLPLAEFHRRLARGWLAWSPAGFSWECFRTSEAAQCLAVPVLNYPTVELHRPLINGEHVLYYNPEPGGLTRAVEAALADKERLKRMALAARAHVLAHHTPRALVDHVIECGLSAKQSRLAMEETRA